MLAEMMCVVSFSIYGIKLNSTTINNWNAMLDHEVHTVRCRRTSGLGHSNFKHT